MPEEKEELEIRVGTNTKPQALASSIVQAYADGRLLILVAIGPFPTAQAYKAVCIANKELASRGKMLCIVPGMEARMLNKRDEPEQLERWVVTTFRLRDYIK